MLITSLSVLGVFLLTQASKKYIAPKYGATGVHIFAFGVALAIVVVKGLMTSFPGFGQFVLTAGEYLAGAIAFYQIIWKQITATPEEV